MLTIFNWNELSAVKQEQVLRRAFSTQDVISTVMSIIEKVKTSGDQALIQLSRQFDGINLSELRVPETLINNAVVDESAMKAMSLAVQNIRTYHQAAIPEGFSITTTPGITIERLYRPIEKIGIYMPGGNKTPLISSILMQAIPGQIAGCPIKILCIPPNADGYINPHVLVAARLCGISEIFTVGGAQAIAALAYGTESIPSVDKIFGPGNRFVTVAKSIVSQDPLGAAIDIPAGPSEVMIMADDDANPAFVAADLLAQAEHGPDSQVILLCDSATFAEDVLEALKQQYSGLKRKSIIEQALQFSAVIVCKNISEQVAIVNRYAPEHLIINRQDTQQIIPEIFSAGTIFVGAWSAETLGDYVTGSNHVLPTSGFARSHSGLSTLDFLKAMSVQTVTPEGIRLCGEAAALLANLEGLDGHANAINQRLNVLRS